MITTNFDIVKENHSFKKLNFLNLHENQTKIKMNGFKNAYIYLENQYLLIEKSTCVL